MYLRQIGIDCNIILEKSRFSAPSIQMIPVKCGVPSMPPMPVIPRFILRLMFGLLNFSHLLSFHIFVTSTTIWRIGPSPISSFFNRHSLIRSNSPISEASKILLLGHFWLTFLLRCSAGSSLNLDGCRRTF